MNRHTWMRGALALTIVFAAVGCASSGGPGASAAAAAPDYTNELGSNGLLTPRALIARCVDASGGEAAMRSHQSSTMTGKFSMAAMGVEGDLVVKAAAPDKIVMDIELGGMGTMSNGYNGEIGWSENPMTGSQLLEGEALELVKLQAAFYGPLDYSSLFTSMETVEKTDFAGESAYKVKLMTPSGKEQYQYYSEASGLLIGMEGDQDNGMGSQHVVTVMSDYKDFGGVQIPTKNTASVMGMEIVQTYDDVAWDNVEASAFEPPDSIKALLN